MPADAADTTDGDRVSVRIAATAEQLYDIVSDVTRMGRLSPECTGGRWLGSKKEPSVGARFVGFNRRGVAWWCTLNRVVAAERGREFAFETGGSGTRWGYEFDEQGDSTTVSESRRAYRPRPLVARAFSKLVLGGADEHDDEMRAGMRATLERLKVLAESQGSSSGPGG